MRVGDARGWELCAEDSWHNPTARARPRARQLFSLRLSALSLSLLQTMVLLRVIYFTQNP